MIIQAANRLNSVKEYYFSHKLREIRELNSKGADIINLGIGSPDLSPHPKAMTAMAECASSEGNHGYQSYTGLPQFRTAIAQWYLKTYNVVLNPENEILPLMGSKEGIMHISMAFLNPGDQVLVPDPGYLAYQSTARLTGAICVNYSLNESDNWQPDFEALEAMDHSKTKIMWVNYPNMPTGASGSDELFKKLIAFAKKHKILIVNDNPYSLVLNPNPSSILCIEGAKDVCLELNSLSKSHNMAGWRVGMLLGNPQYLKEVLKVKSNMDSGMFKGTQLAAIEALNSEDAWHQKRNDIYTKRKAYAQEILRALDCNFEANQVGLFVWAKVPNSVDSVGDWIDQILYKSEVFITPGFIFGNNGNRYVRISLCAPEATLLKALNRIQKFSNSVFATESELSQS